MRRNSRTTDSQPAPKSAEVPLSSGGAGSRPLLASDEQHSQVCMAVDTLGFYVLRSRLREAALRLLDTDGSSLRIVDVAFACGFGDLSNVNHCFRAEFGVNPREYRKNRSKRV